MKYVNASACGILLSGLVLIGLAVAADTLKAPLIACPSDQTVIGGVNACGKIWKIASGEVTLNGDGKLTVDIHGLVLNDASVGQYNGSPDGVDAVTVAVVCGGKTGTVAAQTEPTALNQKGDVRIDTTVPAPKSCSDPIVLIRERYEGKIGGWLATTSK
jgi:hypothetical protein